MPPAMRARMAQYEQWVKDQDTEYADHAPCPCKSTDVVEREKERNA